MRIIRKIGTESSGHHGHAGRPGLVGGSQPSTLYRDEEYERRRAQQRDALRRYRARQRAAQQPQQSLQQRYNIAEIFAKIPNIISNEDVDLTNQGRYSQDHIDEVIAKLKDVYPMMSEDVLRRFFYIEGMKARVTRVYYNDYQVGIDVSWYLKDNPDAGKVVEQQIYAYSNRTFEFALLNVSDALRDKDIGFPLVMKQVAMAKIFGAENVKLFADITIGVYAWAKEGVDYETSDTKDVVQGYFRRYIGKLKHHNITFNDTSYKSFTKPYQWATYKIPGVKVPSNIIENPDILPGEYDIGKAFMLDMYGHGSWRATIDLTKLLW